MNEFEKYCQIEGLNPYEVLAGATPKRRLPEVINDKITKVMLETPAVTAQIWYKSMDALRVVSRVEGSLHFLNPPNSWIITNEESTKSKPAQLWNKTVRSLRNLSEKEWDLHFLSPRFAWSDESNASEQSQLREFLTERTRAIPDTLYDLMIGIAQDSTDPQSRELVEQLRINREIFNSTIDSAISEFPNSSLLSTGINALLMLGGSRPELLPALAPIGIALSHANVNSRASIGDAMNISLRDVYITAYLVQRFADKYSYGEQKINLSKDVQLAGKQLLTVFNVLSDEVSSSGIVPGGFLGAAGTAMLGDKGVAAAVLLTTIGASKAITTYDSKKNKDFGKWFANSEGEQIKEMEAALADPAVAEHHLQSMYQRSRKMAEYIHGHNSISLSFDQTFPWVIQTVSAYLSWLSGTPQNLAQFLIAGRAGASEQRKITRQVTMHQALQTVERYQSKIRETFSTIAQFRHALKLIAPDTYADSLLTALDTNISFDRETGEIEIHRFIDAAFRIKELGDITIKKGIHHLIGESGAGKSSLLNYLKLFLSEHNVSYTYASVESDTSESIGFKMAKILSEGRNKRVLEYIQKQLIDLDTNRDLREELWRNFEEISGRSLRSSFDLGNISFQVWRKSINNPQELWNEWKAYHAEGYSGEKPDHLIILDLIATYYFKEKVNVQKKDILRTKGSTGESRRAQLALVDLDADFIILDEVISNVDPNNIITMINYLASELNGDLEDKTLIIVAHEPEVLRTFRNVTPSGIEQNVTVLFPDAQITESLDQRFIAQNLEENPDELHDFIIQNVLDKIRGILRKGYRSYKDLDDELMDYIEVLEFDFSFSLAQKMKVVATMMEYRDYVADLELTDFERYYMACTIHTINSNWFRGSDGYIVRDASYYQMIYIANQMKATIPQCFVAEYRGWDPSDYLDDTIRRTVPKVPELSKLDDEDKRAQMKIKDQAVVSIINANAHRLNRFTIENCLAALTEFTADLQPGTYSLGESSELLEATTQIIVKLVREKQMESNLGAVSELLESLTCWTSNLPEFSQQFQEIKERLVAKSVE